MTETIYMAEAGLETIIYIIVVFLWVIGNFLSKSKKKKGRTTPIPRAGESTAEAELREFLENLAGKPEEATEPEEREMAPAPRSVRKRERTRPSAKPVAQPIYRAPVHLPEITAVDMDAMIREMRDGAPSMASSMSTSLSSMGSLFKTSGLTMPSLRYALSTSRPPPAIPVIDSSDLRDPRNLRNLVAAKIILGPPRAFDEYHGVGDYKNSI